MTIVQLPGAWLFRRGPVVGRCARHGRPATELHRVRIVRRPAGVLGRFGGPLLAAMVTLPSGPVATPLWPYCAECGAERSLRLTTGAALCVAAVLPAAAVALTAPLAGFAGLPDPGISGVTALTLGLCAALVLAGLGLIAAASWPVLSAACISRDGTLLLVDAHPEFAEEALRSSELSAGSRAFG